MKFTNRQIWQISYPILISLAMEHLIGLTDTAFLGRVGEVELGASAIAGVYYLAIFMLGFGFSIGAQILIARRNGEGRYAETGVIFQQGVWFLLGLATVMFFASRFFSPRLLKPLIESPGVYQAAIDYLDWRVFGFFFAFVAVMFRAFYVGTTHTRTLTLNSLVMVLTNVLLNYLLIFGKWGFPALGIKGAAIASSIAELVSMLFFIIYTRMSVDIRYGLFRFHRFSLRLLGHILDISVWTMLQCFLSVATWVMFFIAVEHLGERSLAITNIIRSLSAMVFMFINAFASTTNSLVSNLMGAGESQGAFPVFRRILLIGYAAILPLLLGMTLFPEVVLRIYTDNPELVAASIPALMVMLSSHLIALPAFLMFNMVSGTGNTRTALLVEVLALSIYALYVYAVVIRLKSDVAVCWTTEHVYAIALLLLSFVYLKRGKWANKKI